MRNLFLLLIVFNSLTASGQNGHKVPFAGSNVNDTAYCNHVMVIGSPLIVNSIVIGGVTPVFATFIASGDGTTQQFAFTIPSGYTYGNFQMQSKLILFIENFVDYSGIDGTTLYITCHVPPFIGTNNVIFTGFYY